jgi:P-type E1-E2 ATPase
MIEVNIPGWRDLKLEELVLDVNGTLAENGILLPGVADLLGRLGSQLNIHLVTGDTYGTLPDIERELGLRGKRLEPQRQAEQKQAYVRELGVDRVVAIGNGVNDHLMLREAALGIAILGGEGLAAAALREADVVVPDIVKGMELLLDTRHLIATLRV